MSQARVYLILLFAAIALSTALAQQKPAENSSTVARDFSKEAYTIERASTRVVFESDGTGTREVATEIKVLADAGVKTFAVLNFTYTSANETVDIEYVRVRKPDGSVVKTPDYNIQDMPADVSRTAPLYSDVHEKHVAVKGLAVGDVLESLVRYRITKPDVPGHFWQEYSFTKDAISKDEQLEISVPADKYVKVVSPEFKPEIKEEGGGRVYRWTHATLVVPEKDPLEIPRRNLPNPDVHLTTFADWEQVGNWYGNLQKEPLQVTAAIQAKAGELIKGAASEDDKIHALYSFVSLKYHYIGLDFGIGRYQPHAAEEVLDNGYGDCKDKHTLLAALLKAAGIEAWPALINGSRKVDPEVPSPAQFNHVITVVPRGNKMLWLDTTPEVAPYGLILQPLRDKQALVIPTSRPPLLMTTPKDGPFQQDQEFLMEGKLSGDGTFNGHSEQSYRGDTEVFLRTLFRQVPQSQWKETLQRFTYRLNFGGEVSGVRLTPPDELIRAFDISYDYERKNYSDWEHHLITLPMPFLGMEWMKEVKKPLEPVPLGAPGEVVYRAKIALPPGYSAWLPSNVTLIRPFAEYRSSYSSSKGMISAGRRMVIKQSEVDPGSWEELRQFIKAVFDDENQYIRLSGQR